MTSSFHSRLILVIPLLLCTWAYYPALGGGFLFDDKANIANNDLLKIESLSLDNLQQAAFSSHSGPLRRPVAMISFAFNYLSTGMSTFWMKVTNLLIHLFNACLVFFVLGRLLHHSGYQDRRESRNLALVVSTLWLIHPINVTAVAYIVQRMTSLSSTFVLVAICIYIKIRECQRFDRNTLLLVAALLVSWALGLFTKEIAVVLSLYIFLVEWLVFKFRVNSSMEFRSLVGLWSILAAPWFGALAYVIYKPSFITAAYEVRTFGPIHRLMTEFRIVLDYIIKTVVPDSRYMGVYQDSFLVSESLLSPSSTLASLVVLILLLAAAFAIRKLLPLVCLGILWFFAGHIPESTVYGLELKFFHRNYLPCIGLLLAFTLAAHHWLKKYSRYLYALAAVFLLGFTASTRSLSHTWSSDSRMQLIEAINNPGSPRANYRAGQILKAYAIVTEPGEERDKYRDLAVHYFRQIETLPFNDMSGKMGAIQVYMQTGTEPPKELVSQLIEDLKTCRFNVGMANIFETYTNCYINGDCLLDENSYLLMVRSVSENQNVYGYFKRSVLVDYARFLADYRGDYLAAIEVLKQALAVYSVVDDLRTMALYYEKMNMKEEMLLVIQLLEENDKFDVHVKFINEARQRAATLKEEMVN